MFGTMTLRTFRAAARSWPAATPAAPANAFSELFVGELHSDGELEELARPGPNGRGQPLFTLAEAARQVADRESSSSALGLAAIGVWVIRLVHRRPRSFSCEARLPPTAKWSSSRCPTTVPACPLIWRNEAHGGQMSLVSSVRGTVVRFELPTGKAVGLA